MSEVEYDEWGDPINPHPKPKPGRIECRYCTGIANWSETRRAFGYWIDAGLEPPDIKKIQPMCLDCTAHYREMIGLTRHPRRRFSPRR
jgi:hypothetical protein